MKPTAAVITKTSRRCQTTEPENAVARGKGPPCQTSCSPCTTALLTFGGQARPPFGEPDRTFETAVLMPIFVKVLFSALEEIRTPNLLIRSQML